MKNITKYILAAAAAFSSLTACQEFEDFDKTIDGTPGLVYVQTGTENLYTIRVVHKPTGSTGEFFTEFPVRCNTTRHAGVKATSSTTLRWSRATMPSTRPRMRRCPPST